VVLRVGDIQITGGIHGHPLRTVQLCARSRAAIAGGSRGARAREIGDHSVGHAAHRVVRRVGDIQVARGARIHGDTERRIELRTGGGAAVTRAAQQAVAGERTHISARELADPVIQRIGKIDVARGIYSHAGRQTHLHLVGRAAVAGEALYAIPDRGGDLPRSIDLTNAIRAVLRDINIAARIHGNAERRDHRQSRCHAIAAQADAAVAGNTGDDAGGIHLADRAIAGVGDQNRALGSDGNILRPIQAAMVAVPTLVTVPEMLSLW
jgi:hypothetical protein